MTLVDFLLARIAEDEDAAQQDFNFHGSQSHDPRGFDYDCLECSLTYAAPSRVLAECEAKRRIVKWECTYRTTVERRGEDWWHRATGNLRALAAVYADHPDYQQEWA